jgi:hypothetical protein
MPRPRALRVCPCTSCPAHPGSCPELVAAGHCPACRPAVERRRGTRQARGYDSGHDRLRATWARKVKTGKVRCARCRQPIPAGAPWHLDHTDGRTGYLGPSHASCNTSAGGKAAHR